MAESNIGASRLIGTQGLQQAVDSLENQIKKLSNDFSKLSGSIGNMTGSIGRTGSSRTGNNWNSSSNRSNYSNNGGGGSFSGYATFSSSGRGNGGGGRFTPRTSSGMSPNSGSKFAAVSGGLFSVASGLTAYGNQTMPSNMQMDMFANYGARMGGMGAGYDASRIAAQRAVFSNNFLGLGANDIARASYLNTFTSGMSPQTNGGINSGFMRFQSQVNGFGYNSPTQGAFGAAQAAQETYTARSLAMSQALGLRPTLTTGGTPTSMGAIARSIMQRSLSAGKQYTPQNIATALGQSGGLSVNLQYMGQQMGWSQGTIQEYRNYMTNLVNARSKGISDIQFDTLLGKAQSGDKTAQNQLKSAGVGSTMFESQRNLNATRLTRQEDILESLAPAFNDATKAVQNFSQALTTFLQQTHLDKAIGTGAGWGSAISGGLGGFSNTFGAVGGAMTAARLFRMGGGASGGLGGLFSRIGGMFGGGAGGLGSQGANGVYNITTLGGGTSSSIGLAGIGGITAGVGAAGAAGSLGWQSALKNSMSSSVAKASGGFTGPIANLASGGRRAWDKFVTGNSKESIWSLLFNPNGTERRTTSTDGRSGGGSNSNVGGGSSSANGAVNGSGATASQIIHFAETQLGVPYVWGGTTPGKGLDCSGLTQWAFGQAGVKIPRVADAQQSASTRVPLTGIQPGDLLFKGDPAHHVALNIGNGKLIEAPHTGLNVRIRSFSPSEFTNAGRVVNAIGNPSSLLNNNNSGNTNTLNKQQSHSGGDIGNIGSGYSERSTILSALAGSIGSLPATSGSRSTGATSGTGQLGTTPTGNGGNDKSSLQAYAKQLLSKYGWGSQWNSFDALVMSESGWDYKATNPSSGAYGIPQSLPGNKMSSAGSDWMTSGDTQLRWMMDYVKSRYGTPDNAWSFHKKNNWYSAGAYNIDKDQSATVHKGEMIIPAKQAESIRQVLMNNSFNPGLQSQGTSGLHIGNIVVNLPQGYMGSQQDAYNTGRNIVDAIVNDTRIKNLQKGQ